MNGIAIMGNKGGTGKTSIAHLLALGAAWNKIPAHFMHTDDREPIKVNGRPYMYYDARKPEILKTLVIAAINNDGICIIDCGGNRPEFDKWVCECVDLIIIPVCPDPEDVKEAITHAKRLKNNSNTSIKFLINKYPFNHMEKKFVTRYFDKLPQEMVIDKIGEVKAVRLLRESDENPFKTPPLKVNNLARLVYRQVKEELEKN